MAEKELDRLSYALGVSMGYNFRASGIQELNVDDFADALGAVFYGRATKMTAEEAKTEVQSFFMQLQQKQQEENAKMADINAAAGEQFLLENGKRAEVHTTPSGLQYEIVKQGDGPRPTAGDSVTVHYTGKLIDGTVFDSSVDRGEPADFAITQVVPGFGEGLKMMNKGSKYILYIPSNLAYGDNATGSIPAGSTLVFEVEVLDITAQK